SGSTPASTRPSIAALAQTLEASTSIRYFMDNLTSTPIPTLSSAGTLASLANQPNATLHFAEVAAFWKWCMFLNLLADTMRSGWVRLHSRVVMSTAFGAGRQLKPHH
ncbi:MAG: hypothetical protein WD178_02840, partial [Actinomycetota bacterium]